MSGSARLIDAAMATWAPDTRHYLLSDGRHVAIHVHDGLTPEALAMINETLELSEQPLLDLGRNEAIVVSPTVVLPCSPEGLVIGESVPEPLSEFPPGTTHAEALDLLGYPLVTA